MAYIKYVEGSVVKNKHGDGFRILQINYGEKYPTFIVESIDTGFTREISRSALYSGKYLDKLKSFNKNGGIIGYANTRKNKLEHNVWHSMLERCNNKDNESYQFYGGVGVRVCERWHRFDLFLEDIVNIPGYDKNLFEQGEIQLDKDISGQRLYSPDTCVFLCSNENASFTKRQKLFKYQTPDGHVSFHINKKEVGKMLNIDDSAICKALNHGDGVVKGVKFEYVDANDYQKGDFPSRVSFVQTE